jgi:EAL domain-containing protein (putative c-di-GMP-specific phosphodiesterase class I)
MKYAVYSHRTAKPTNSPVIRNGGEQLDRRIIEQVMRRLSKDAITNWRFVVNLSHNSLASVHFLRWLEGRLSGRRSLASKLVLQISETDALIAQHHLCTFCEVIEKLGCKLSVSTFGYTPKPLRYLSLVPAAYVKLDKGLSRKVDVIQANLKFLSSLIEELHERGISAITLRLEQLPILPLLWQGNCLHPPSISMNFEFIETQTISFGSR